LIIIGACMILAGGVWILQGVDILPGSFMTGQIQWAIYGSVSALGGIGLLLYANRRRHSGPNK